MGLPRAHISPFTCGFISLDTDKWRAGVIVMWTRGWSPAVTGTPRGDFKWTLNLNSAVDGDNYSRSVGNKLGPENNIYPSAYTCGTTEGKDAALRFKDMFHLFSSAEVCCVFFIKFTEFNKEAWHIVYLTKHCWFGSWRMKCLSDWLPAAALLLLSVAAADTKHLQAENLNMIHPDEHQLVLNRGMRGTYLCTLSLSDFSFLALLAVLLRNEMHMTCVGSPDLSPVIALKCWIVFISWYVMGCGSDSRLWTQIAQWLISDKRFDWGDLCVLVRSCQTNSCKHLAVDQDLTMFTWGTEKHCWSPTHQFWLN